MIFLYSVTFHLMNIIAFLSLCYFILWVIFFTIRIHGNVIVEVRQISILVRWNSTGWLDCMFDSVSSLTWPTYTGTFYFSFYDLKDKVHEEKTHVLFSKKTCGIITVLWFTPVHLSRILSKDPHHCQCVGILSHLLIWF